MDKDHFDFLMKLLAHVEKTVEHFENEDRMAGFIQLGIVYGGLSEKIIQYNDEHGFVDLDKEENESEDEE